MTDVSTEEICKDVMSGKLVEYCGGKVEVAPAILFIVSTGVDNGAEDGSIWSMSRNGRFDQNNCKVDSVVSAMLGGSG